MLTLLFLLPISTCELHGDPGKALIKLDCRLSIEGDDFVLAVDLTNTSGKPIRINRHFLPWVGWYSIQLTAIRDDAFGTVIEKENMLDCLGAIHVTIKPDEKLSGRIVLNKRFKGLESVLRGEGCNFGPMCSSPLVTTKENDTGVGC